MKSAASDYGFKTPFTSFAFKGTVVGDVMIKVRDYTATYNDSKAFVDALGGLIGSTGYYIYNRCF